MLSRRLLVKIVLFLPVAATGVTLFKSGALSQREKHFGLIDEALAKRMSDRCDENLDPDLIDALTKRFEKNLFCERTFSYPKEWVRDAIADDYRKGQHQLVDRVLLSDAEIGMFSFVAKHAKS